jgi:hypothetical protein
MEWMCSLPSPQLADDAIVTQLGAAELLLCPRDASELDSIDARGVAEALTAMDHPLFVRITYADMLSHLAGQGGMPGACATPVADQRNVAVPWCPRPHLDPSSPLEELVDHYNRVSAWIVFMVTRQTDARRQTQSIEVALQVGGP